MTGKGSLIASRRSQSESRMREIGKQITDRNVQENRSMEKEEALIPGAAEQRSFERLLQRTIVQKPSPAVRVKATDRGPVIVPEEYPGMSDWQAELLLQESLGILDPAALKGFLYHLGNASRRNDAINEQELNFKLEMIKSMKPRNELEAMLASLMVETFAMAMGSSGRFTDTTLIMDRDRDIAIAQQNTIIRNYSQLSRTYATLVETFNRGRTGGEQKVVVQHQHVSVGEGGQAIVGQVHTEAKRKSAEAKRKSAGEPPAGRGIDSGPALTDADESPMPIMEESKEVAPLVSAKRQKK